MTRMVMLIIAKGKQEAEENKHKQEQEYKVLQV